MAHTLRKVDKDFTFDEQRVEINELAVDVYNLQHDFGQLVNQRQIVVAVKNQ